MRGTANPRSFKPLYVAIGGLAMVLSAHADAVAADAMEAIMRPVNRNTGAPNPDISMGTARFTTSGDKTQVVIQVSGVSVAGSEEGASADGTGNVYPRSVLIFSGTCEAAVKSNAAGAEKLPDLPVRSDGSGTLIATTSTSLSKLTGQTVLLSKPNKPGEPTGVPVACGTIAAK